MAEESKSPVPPLESEKRPAAEKPAAAASAAPEKAVEPAKPATVSPPAPATTAPAAAAKPAAPPKPTGSVPLPWTSPLVEKYRRQYGSGIEALTYLGQNYLSVDRSLIPDILRLLRDEEQFDYCVDITAVHYPKRERQFDVLWILYSFPRNGRLRVKTQIADGASIPSGRLPTGSSARSTICSASDSMATRT
jgi:NADH-quinone oxidoreductase subunit C